MAIDLYDDIESKVLAMALKYTHLVPKLKSEHFSREGFRNIFDIAGRHLSSSSSISRSIILALKKDLIIYDYELDLIFDVVSRLPNELTALQEEDFIGFLDILNDRIRRDRHIILIDQAREWLLEGDEVAAISILKSLSFRTNVKINSLLSDMVSSLEETNSFPTGVAAIDQKMGGFNRGNLMLLIGATGSMKTMSSLTLCESILKANPEFTCLYFEKEMPVKDVALKFVSKVTDVDVSTLLQLSSKKGKARTDIEKLSAQMMETIEANPEMKDIVSRIKIVANTDFNNANDIYSIIDKYKPDIWCLDYLTMLKDDTSNGTEYEHFWDQINVLKKIVHNTNTFGIILNQVKQNAISNKIGAKIPSEGDSEYASKANQYSAYIYSTFYPYRYIKSRPKDWFYLVCLKNRFGEYIHVPYIVDPSRAKFTEIVPGLSENDNMLSWLDGYISGKKGLT